MKKWIALFLSALMLCSMLSVAVAEEPTYDLQGKTVKIRLWDSVNPYAEDVTDVDKEKYLPIYEAAKAKYNCDFSFFTSTVEYDDMPNEFAMSVAGGQPVWHITNNLSSMWLMTLVANNAMYDVTKAVATLEIPQLMKEAAMVGEGTYGFITGYPGTEGLVFNVDMIDEAGMEFTPAEMFEQGKWSYDDFFAYMSELQSKLPEGSYSFFIDPNYWQIFAATANGTMAVTKDFQMELKSDAFIETIEFLQKLWNAGVCRPANTTDTGAKDHWGTPAATFDVGVEVAMTHRATWQMGGLNNNGINWGFVPYPWGSNVTIAGDYTTLSDNYRAGYYDLGVTGSVLAGFENDFPGMDPEYVAEALVNLAMDLFIGEETQEWLAGEVAGTNEAAELEMRDFNDELSAVLYNWLTTRTEFNPIANLYNASLAVTSAGTVSFPGLIRNIVYENLSVRASLEAAAVEIEAGLRDAGFLK